MNVLRAQVIRNSIKVNLLKYITFNEYILSFHVIKKKKIFYDCLCQSSKALVTTLISQKTQSTYCAAYVDIDQTRPTVRESYSTVTSVRK